MKYFEMNLGDYAEATSHLTLLEDAVYFRLLRKYYATERPLPADIKAVQRLVCARTKQEREAVRTILEEFFVLEEDGWHNARCDAEIEKYRHKRDRSAGRDSGDSDRGSGGSERLHRHREERRQLMAALRQRGINPAWDTPVPKLREMLDQAMAQSKQAAPETPPETPETHLKRQPETPETPPETRQPITIIQEPRTNNQKHRSTPSSLEVLPAREARNDDDAPKDVAGWIDFFRSEHGIVIDPHSVHDRKKFWPLATAWTKAGVTVGQMRQAIAKARSQATEPIAYLPAYADRVLMTSTAKPPRLRATTLNPQEALENQNRAVAESWLAQIA